jgi:hypothetical protein
MDYGRTRDLIDYWAEWPPAHVLLRGFVGFKPAASASASTLDDVREIAGKIGGP